MRFLISAIFGALCGLFVRFSFPRIVRYLDDQIYNLPAKYWPMNRFKDRA
jgi:NhaP-type Na+/H+ or K+/H+ antiporter